MGTRLLLFRAPVTLSFLLLSRRLLPAVRVSKNGFFSVARIGSSKTRELFAPISLDCWPRFAGALGNGQGKAAA
jgi:hypothetical protein